MPLLLKPDEPEPLLYKSPHKLWYPRVQYFLHQRACYLETQKHNLIVHHMRHLKCSNPEAFEIVMRRFGMFQKKERSIAWVINYNTMEREYIMDALQYVCPGLTEANVYFEILNCETCEMIFAIEWKTLWMDCIVYNKFLFPDFVPYGIHKNKLDF